jgi:hypothetical protein
MNLAHPVISRRGVQKPMTAVQHKRNGTDAFFFALLAFMNSSPAFRLLRNLREALSRLLWKLCNTAQTKCSDGLPTLDKSPA